MEVRRPRIGARRAAAALVLVTSCAALLATSQPPDRATLTANSALEAVLDGEAPRASGTLRITLSAEALPAYREGGPLLGGGLRLQLSGNDQESMVLSARGIAAPLAMREDYNGMLIPIEQLCRVAEPCSADVEVGVEWLGVTPRASIQASVLATLEVIYDGVLETPTGATAAVDELVAMAPTPGGPALHAQTPQERLVLDRDHWAAARHVTLRASQEALAGRTLAFLDQTVGQLDRRSQVRVSVIPDERPGETLDGLAPFDPFADCPRTAPCERGFTVRFELPMTDAASAASVAWSFGARAAFPDAEDLPAGGRLDVAVDGVHDATLDAPAIRASASGTVATPDPDTDGPHAVRWVEIDIRAAAAALPRGGFGGLGPAARGILTVQAAGAANLSISFTPAPDNKREEYLGASLTAEAPEVSVLFNPLRGCPSGVACRRTVLLRVSRSGPDASSDEPLEVTWELDLALAYPGLDGVPRLAELELTHRTGSR